MTTPRGFIELIAEFDALPILVAGGEIALVGKLAPTAGGARAMILLRSGERLATGTEYKAVVERLALRADPRTCDSSTRGWRCQT